MSKRILIPAIIVLLAAGSWLWLSHRSTPLGPIVPKEAQASYPVAILGDSLVEGIGASTPDNDFANQLFRRIKIQQPNATLVNTGVSGAVIDDVLNGQTPSLNGKTFRLIIVVVGTNDITHLNDKNSFQRSLDALTAKLSTLSPQLLFLNVPKFAATPDIPDVVKRIADSRTKDFNDVYAAEGKANPNLRVFDFYTLSANVLSKDSSLISNDGFHPNDAGYQKMAEAAANSIL